MSKQGNQVNKELKQPEAQETNHSLYIRQLRGRNVNEESHTPPISHPSPGPTHMHIATQSLKSTNHLPPP